MRLRVFDPGERDPVLCIKRLVREWIARCGHNWVTFLISSMHCCASVIVWQIRDFARMSKLVLRETLRAEPSSIAFDRTGTLVALCCDRVVQVFVIDRREVFVTLEGHLARVRDASLHDSTV